VTFTFFLRWAHDTWLGHMARDIWWFFTAGLIIHFTGLCLLMGAMLIIDLRVLGFAKNIPVASVLGFLPWALLGFGMNLATGIMFFTFDPFAYWHNPAFKIKLSLIVLAGLNALWFALLQHRKALTPDSGTAPGMFTRVSAGISLGLWILVIVAGRMIVAFQGSPNLFY